MSSRPNEFPPASVDPSEDTRGRWFIDECNENNLIILNGSSFDSTSIIDDSGWTSFQPNGRAVVDYVAVSVHSLLGLKRFAGVNLTSWSDHVFLSLAVTSHSKTLSQDADLDHRLRRPRFFTQIKQRAPFTALPPSDALLKELRGPPALLDSPYSEPVLNTEEDVNRTTALYGEPFFWSMIRDLTDPKPPKPKVSLNDLAAEFERRAHIPDTFPPEFETVALELAALECSAIPSCTTDRISRHSFSRHFVREEIIRNRDSVAQRLQSTPPF